MSDKMPNPKTLKHIAATASIGVALFLSGLKIFASIYTGSLAILSSLVDSLADIFASAITFFAVKISTKPATCEYRYGFGKAESVSALLQAAFIAGSGLFVIYGAINRLFHPIEVKQTLTGIIIMLISMIITLLLIIFQKYVIKKTDSMAINADSTHYSMDLLTNLVIVSSLFITKYFSIIWIDTLTALLVAVYILYNAFNIAKKALFILTDKELSSSTRIKIKDIIMATEGVMGMHDFRTHDLGGTYMFEVHIEIDGNLLLSQAHDISEQIENKILKIYPNSQIIIHQDPYGIKEKRLDYILPNHCTKV